MRTTCLVCKAPRTNRGKHRCSPGILADQHLEQVLAGQRVPRSRAEVLALLRATWLEGFGECDLLRKLGLLRESGFLVDYVLRYRPAVEGGPVKRARLPRRMTV